MNVECTNCFLMIIYVRNGSCTELYSKSAFNVYLGNSLFRLKSAVEKRFHIIIILKQKAASESTTYIFHFYQELTLLMEINIRRLLLKLCIASVCLNSNNINYHLVQL